MVKNTDKVLAKYKRYNSTRTSDKAKEMKMHHNKINYLRRKEKRLDAIIASGEPPVKERKGMTAAERQRKYRKRER